MMPSLGVKYQIEIEVVSKPKAEYTTDEYFIQLTFKFAYALT